MVQDFELEIDPETGEVLTFDFDEWCNWDWDYDAGYVVDLDTGEIVADIVCLDFDNEVYQVFYRYLSNY